MDSTDAIIHLAHAEAARVRVLRDPAEAPGKPLPFFVLKRMHAGGDVAISEYGGHIGHDNEPRLQYVCDFMQRRVLPFIDPSADVSGVYRIELHDSYSYLPDCDAYSRAGALTFSRPRGTNDAMSMIPDPYQMGAYGGMLAAHDTVPWGSKKPQMLFAGTTTGSRDPALNARIRACVWALDHPLECLFRITNIAQMHPSDAYNSVPRFKDILSPPLSQADHFNYRYIVNIAGNTACWSRVPMVLASRSVMVNVHHADMCWYYPLLREGEHYFAVKREGDDMLALRNTLESNPTRCQIVAQAANRFCSTHLSPMHAAMYMARFLEEAAWRSKA